MPGLGWCPASMVLRGVGRAVHGGGLTRNICVVCRGSAQAMAVMEPCSICGRVHQAPATTPRNLGILARLVHRPLIPMI